MCHWAMIEFHYRKQDVRLSYIQYIVQQVLLSLITAWVRKVDTFVNQLVRHSTAFDNSSH